jgi:hypothetical protein
LLLSGRYRAFGLNAALMAASMDLVSQPSDMSNVQPPLLHSMKLETPDNLVTCLVTLLRVLFPTFHPQLPLHTPLLAIPSVVSTQSLSSLLLVHLVIPTSLSHYATPILVSIPVSCNALDA